MAIQYAGGTRRNDVYVGVATRPAVIANIKTSLEAAGWTATELFPFSVLQNAVPANNETVTLDGKVYTYKTVINNGVDGEIAVGVDAPTSIANLKAAVNLGAGAGTAYSSATTLNTNLRAGILTSTTLTIEQKVIAAGPYNVSETFSSGNFTVATTSYTGYKFQCATTAQYQAMKLFFYNAADSNTKVRWFASNVDETEVGPQGTSAQQIFGAASTDIRVIACRYQCFVMIDGAAGNVAEAFMGAGVPWIPNLLTAVAVIGATNASPIVITTGAAHGLSTGDFVTIRQVGGNTAANVTNNEIIVLTPTTYSLNGTTGNGAYTTGGVAGEHGTQIVECIWAVGSDNGNIFWRVRFTASTVAHWTALNGSTITTGNGVGCLAYAGTVGLGGNSNGLTDNLMWYNDSFLVTEPALCLGPNAGSDAKLVGIAWDMAIERKTLDRDLTGTFDSNNWWQLTDGITSGPIPLRASAWVVVP